MEDLPSPKDYAEETALAQRVARIFGYDGLTIDVREGAGWATIRGEDSITLVVDPTMLQPQTFKDATGEELSTGTQAPAQYSVYGVAHELGHVDDFMQPESDPKEQKEMKPSEHFFWNVLDDGVINKRLKNIPLLNSLTDEIYEDMLFPIDDYSNMPKHVQLMYGWLLRNVTPQREVTFSDDVVQALDSLNTVEIGKKRFDIYRTLAHPDTTYEKRKEIAETHILPIYETFLEEDRQSRDQQNQSNDQGTATDEQSDAGSDSKEQQEDDSQSDGSSSSPDEQQGDNPSANQGGEEQGGNDMPANWDEIYDAYKDASHCGHEYHEENKKDGQDTGTDTDDDPHEIIKQAAGALKDRQAQQAEDNAQKEAGETSQSGIGEGSIAAELELSPDDALAYQAVVEQYRNQIHEVAKVLQQLTVPSIEYTSPRYQRRADTSGLKLSPRDLFQVIVAQHSNVDPAVWKPVETISKKEGFSFNGLDIHVVVDSSGSMGGQKADSAAACSVMLMEGVAAARRMVERYNPRSPKPDVRLQVALFGSSAEVVAPLSHETKSKDKGITFTTVRDANSSSTLVTEALELTLKAGISNPERTQLVYLITDGDFHDRANATAALNNARMNYFLYQYILLSSGTTPITTQAAHLDDPHELPGHLNNQLKVLASRFLV